MCENDLGIYHQTMIILNEAASIFMTENSDAFLCNTQAGGLLHEIAKHPNHDFAVWATWQLLAKPNTLEALYQVVNTVDAEGHNALFPALVAGNRQLVALLLRAGALSSLLPVQALNHFQALWTEESMHSVQQKNKLHFNHRHREYSLGLKRTLNPLKFK